MKNKKIDLGVNIDHAATLRQLRGGTTSYPDLNEVVKQVKAGGADQITLHLREDRRHIQDHDVNSLLKNRVLKYNLEMAVTEEMVRIAKKAKPDWVCFVPEKRQELTTEGGLDVTKKNKDLKKFIPQLIKCGIQCSLFIEPSLDQVFSAKEVGAHAVEFHTGKWVLLTGKKKIAEWNRLKLAAQVAYDLGLRVHAGHGLDYNHVKLITQLPFLQEVNIGHSVICYSLIDGLKSVCQKMKKCLNRSK